LFSCQPLNPSFRRYRATSVQQADVGRQPSSDRDRTPSGIVKTYAVYSDPQSRPSTRPALYTGYR